MQCVRSVLDSSGRMRETFTDVDGNIQLRNNDALDKSLAVNRPLYGVVGDAALDDNEMCAAIVSRINASRSMMLTTVVPLLLTQLCMALCRN